MICPEAMAIALVWACAPQQTLGYNTSVSETATLPARILVVDDDEGVTQTFARMLRLEGFQVRTAMNAEKGLQAVSETHADAIILDLRMPLVDGVGFLRRLR